jgi:hypothetical protein
MRIVVALCVAAALAGSASAGTTFSKPLKFKTFARAAKEVQTRTQPKVQPGVLVTDRAVTASNLAYVLPGQEQRRIAANDFNKRYFVALYALAPTSGYTVALKRMVISSYGAHTDWTRQLCVTAVIKKPAPGVPVRARATYVSQVVSLPAARGWAPTTWVLSDVNGKFLNVSDSYPDPLVQGYRTGVPTACPG